MYNSSGHFYCSFFMVFELFYFNSHISVQSLTLEIGRQIYSKPKDMLSKNKTESPGPPISDISSELPHAPHEVLDSRRSPVSESCFGKIQ